MVTIELIEQPSIAELEAEIRATEEAGVAGIRQWVEAAWLAERKVAELEAQLATANETIADLRDLAYNRAPKNAAEEADRQKAEFEARLKVAESEAKADRKTLGEEITHWLNEFEKAEARAEAVRDLADSLQNIVKKAADRAEKAEAEAGRLDSINGQLLGHIRTVRDRLNDLLIDEDLDDEKLRSASEGLLPNIVDTLTAALSHAEQDGNDNAA